MPHRFADIAFTPTVRRVQEQRGSRASYSRMDTVEGNVNHQLSEAEATFIAARDSLYMATVSETGWPYVQHRGGPKGFVRVLDETTIGFADFRGNRQYVSVGNLMTNDRVSLFFMDYVNRTRLKLLGRIRIRPVAKVTCRRESVELAAAWPTSARHTGGNPASMLVNPATIDILV